MRASKLPVRHRFKAPHLDTNSLVLAFKADEHITGQFFSR